eukprot:4723139-Prymnesium_polylepis.2
MCGDTQRGAAGPPREQDHASPNQEEEPTYSMCACSARFAQAIMYTWRYRIVSYIYCRAYAQRPTAYTAPSYQCAFRAGYNVHMKISYRIHHRISTQALGQSGVHCKGTSIPLLNSRPPQSNGLAHGNPPPHHASD